MNVEVFNNFWMSNRSRKDRVEWIAKLASISYGNEEAKNPEKLVKTLILRGHQSLFEFIRCPIFCYKSLKLVNFGIEDSLRHNPDLKTFSDYLSAGYDDMYGKLVQWHTQALALLKIQTPIFVDRQLVRHRSDSRIEMSRRYVKPDKVEFAYWFPEEVSNIEAECFTEEMNQRYQRNFKRFGRAELARYDQPLNLYTTYYVLRDYKGARNFYIRRFNKHAQKETRELVEKELRTLKQQQPEFLGQYVYLEGEKVHILNLKSIGESLGKEKLHIDYGDKHYWAVFDVESGLFVDDEPKEPKKLLFQMFGIEETQ